LIAEGKIYMRTEHKKKAVHARVEPKKVKRERLTEGRF